MNYDLSIDIMTSNTNSNTQSSIEEAMKNRQYEFFNEWVSNFALNLPAIWDGKSAQNLNPSLDENYKPEEHSAIVIGRGPAIKKFNHLKLLLESNYQGSIVVCDGKLIDALNAGITPERFPKFYVVTIDPYPEIQNYYNDDIVDKYGSKIKGIFTVLSNPNTVERAKKAGIDIHWIHSLFDYGEGKKSFNQISALMVRAKNHLNGLPGIQTGGNVGTSSWFVSWQILKCSTVGLIGINHGWEEDDSWEKIVCHGNFDLLKNIDLNDPSLKQLFPKIHNPEFNCNCILDPVFQFYSSALKEFISRSPKWVNTINATEGGSIFGDRITCIPFHEFLKKYNV